MKKSKTMPNEWRTTLLPILKSKGEIVQIIEGVNL
jgi:hypothetical protein